MRTRVAYLGPKGTYAEQAAFALAKLEKLNSPIYMPCQGLHAVIEHLSNNLCETAVVPIENSVEGGVTSTLDALWKYKNLFIHRAIVLPIRHALLSSGSLNSVSEVLSHPQALAQCSSWLNQNLPNALQLPTSSTAEAIKMIKGSQFRAAIGSKIAGDAEGLVRLAYPINDITGNRTRFILLHKENLKKTGNKASIAFSLQANTPGSLLQALNCIASLGLNMSRIESRPSKRELGEYVFFVDLDLETIKNETSYIKLQTTLKPFCDHIVDFGCYTNSEIE